MGGLSGRLNLVPGYVQQEEEDNQLKSDEEAVFNDLEI